MRNQVELMHAITVLYNWATDEKETISKLTDKQAKEALYKVNAVWPVIERRKGKR